MSESKSRGKILFQLSGSIACFKACQLLSKLVQAGFEVETVATTSALSFVGEATLEGLTGRRVHTEVFASGEYMQHIHLARWADLILLCPATASRLNKLASGIGDDLISTLFLAHDFKKPYLVAPAMNTSMLQHPASQAALAKLTDWGIEILSSGAGALACGEVGEGRLLEPDALFEEITKRFVTRAATPLNILITSGGTREPIDGVRAITNTSTGKTGAALAEHFISRGHRVTFLNASGSVSPKARPTKSLEFISFDDLEVALRGELGGRAYDAVVHAAAVSDFKVDHVDVDGRRLAPEGKIESGETLQLALKRTPKLVDQLRSFSKNAQVKVVAFKLTNTTEPSNHVGAVQKLLMHANADFIVHNDLYEIDVAAGKHAATIYDGSGRPVANTATKQDLARELERMLVGGNQ